MCPDYLVHFNPNHDPKTGQFAEGHNRNAIQRHYDRKQKRLVANYNMSPAERHKMLTVSKYQNIDGSLTRRGQATFGKLVKLKAEYENQVKKSTEAANEEHKYLKKNGLLGPSGESYKEDMREAYLLDKNFRPIADRSQAEWAKTRELGKKLIAEESRVAHLNDTLFTLIGRDVVDQVLNDYQTKQTLVKQLFG